MSFIHGKMSRRLAILGFALTAFFLGFQLTHRSASSTLAPVPSTAPGAGGSVACDQDVLQIEEEIRKLEVRLKELRSLNSGKDPDPRATDHWILLSEYDLAREKIEAKYERKKEADRLERTLRLTPDQRKVVDAALEREACANEGAVDPFDSPRRWAIKLETRRTILEPLTASQRESFRQSVEFDPAPGSDEWHAYFREKVLPGMKRDFSLTDGQAEFQAPSLMATYEKLLSEYRRGYADMNAGLITVAEFASLKQASIGRTYEAVKDILTLSQVEEVATYFWGSD